MVDLGCGDGRVVIAAGARIAHAACLTSASGLCAAKAGMQACGVEVSAQCLEETRRSSEPRALHVPIC